MAKIGGSMPSAFRITTVGVYHILRLSRLFPYFDAIIVDTPILDPSVRERVHDVQRITERLARCEIFLRYLDEQWQKVHGAGPSFDWTTVSSDVQAELEYIRNSPRVKSPT
jgi:hypothetical protein